MPGWRTEYPGVHWTVVDREGLDLNLRPGGQSDWGTYMEVRSPVVLWRELKEGAALAGAPLRLGEEVRRREAGRGVKAGGEAECGATPDMVEPGLRLRWSPAALLTYCSSAPPLDDPGMRPAGELACSAATSIRWGIPPFQLLRFRSSPP